MTERGTIGPFPELVFNSCGGEEFAELSPRHHLKYHHPVKVPPEFSWGQVLEVEVRHHRYTPPPRQTDSCGTEDYYMVEKTLSAQSAPAGACFDLEFNKYWTTRSLENLEALFQPSILVFRDSSLKERVSTILAEQTTDHLTLRGCFRNSDRHDVEIVSLESPSGD